MRASAGWPSSGGNPRVSRGAAIRTAPSKSALHVTDADTLANSTTLRVSLNQPARMTWRIVDAAGTVARFVRNDEQVPAGTLRFDWDGRDESGALVADGIYRSVVSAQTGLGAYQQERSVFVGAF